MPDDLTHSPSFPQPQVPASDEADDGSGPAPDHPSDASRYVDGYHRLFREFQALEDTKLGEREARAIERSRKTDQPVRKELMHDLLSDLLEPSKAVAKRVGPRYGLDGPMTYDALQNALLSFHRWANIDDIPRDGDLCVVRPLWQRTLINNFINEARRSERPYVNPRKASPGEDAAGETPRDSSAPKHTSAKKAYVHVPFDEETVPVHTQRLSPEELVHGKRVAEARIKRSPHLRGVYRDALTSDDSTLDEAERARRFRRRNNGWKALGPDDD